MCDKVSYSSKGDAQFNAKLITCLTNKKRGKYWKNLKPLRAYECNRCNKWHLTSQPYRAYTDSKEQT